MSIAGGGTTWKRLQADFWLVAAGGTPYRLLPPEAYRFGRDPGCAFAIPDAPLSRRHAELRWDPAAARWRLADLGSRNGTFLNEQRLEPGGDRPLADLDLLRLGGRRFTYYALPAGTDVEAFLRESRNTIQGTLAGGGPSGAGDAPGAVFRGKLDRGGLLAVLEFLTMTRKTGKLELGDDRFITVVDGDPRAARCGTVMGLPAFEAIAAAPGEEFCFRDGPPPPIGPASIALPGQELRLLLAHALGGAGHAATQTPSHTQRIEDGDLERAGSIQSRLMARLPQIKGWRFGCRYTPHNAVGGDLYEAARLPDGRLLIALGDVSGHGVQGALVVALALKALRLFSRETQSLAELVGRLDADLHGDLVPGQFITVFAATIDPATGHVDAVLAGHHPAFIIRAAGGVERLGSGGPAVGLLASGKIANLLKPVRTTLGPGDLLLQCTDGILEASDAERREYSDHRLPGFLPTLASLAPQAAVDALVDDVASFALSIDDDVTVLAVGRDAVES